MNLSELEKRFQRAWSHQDKKKFLLVFFTCCISGLLVVFSRVLALTSGRWVILSLSFLPMFVSTTLLFALGVLLINLYQMQKEGEELSLGKVVLRSWKSIVSICYITLPLFLVYLLSWLILGIFFLLKEIPGIGDFVGVLLSFGPFLLFLGGLFLAFMSFALLFFLTPYLAKSEELNLELWVSMRRNLKNHLFIHSAFFIVSAIPILFILSFLIAAATLTKISYFSSSSPVLVGLQWFFLMLPFNALLTPFIIFFFNFSLEAYDVVHQEALVKNSMPSV